MEAGPLHASQEGAQGAEDGCMEGLAAPRLQQSVCMRWGVAGLPVGLEARSPTAPLRWIAWACSQVAGSDRGAGEAAAAALSDCGPKADRAGRRCIIAVAEGPPAAIRGLVGQRESLWVIGAQMRDEVGLASE